MTNQTRGKRVLVCMTAEHHEALKHWATEKGVSVNEYIVHAIEAQLNLDAGITRPTVVYKNKYIYLDEEPG